VELQVVTANRSKLAHERKARSHSPSLPALEEPSYWLYWDTQEGLEKQAGKQLTWKGSNTELKEDIIPLKSVS
jgi:hypothetical protein